MALGVALACSSSGGEQSGPASDTASTTAGSDTASTTASSGTGEDGCILKGEDPGERPCVAADLTTEEIVEGGRGFAKSRTWDFFQGDVNGDGIKDLAVADEAGYHFALRPPLLVGEPAIDVDAILAGVGGFSISIAGFADTLLLSQRSGDVNGDGRDDVLLIYKEGSIVIVFVLFSPGVGAPIDVETIGTTTPGLRLELADTGAGWYNLAHSGGVDLVTEVVDLSGDGRAEILVGGQTLVGMDDSWRGFAVFPGRADTALLSLDSPGVLYRTGMGPAAAADLDGDGAPELVVSRNGCSAGCWDNLQVEVLHAPFEVADADGRIDLAEHIGVGDIDGDGRDDILYCDFHESCGDRGGVVFGRAWPAVVGASSPCASGFSVSRAWGSVFMAPIGDVNGDGRAGYDRRRLRAIILTHAHWDHVSGLPELAGTPLWIPAEERRFIADGGALTAVARGLGDLPIEELPFEEREYLGFPRSHDVYGDGAVVIVHAPGHTPGSVLVFLALPDGRRLALLGDLVWQLEGILEREERPWLLHQLGDSDPAAVREQILRVAAIAARFPEIVLVPAHDPRGFAGLPRL